MKKFCLFALLMALLLAPTTYAGTLTINGDLVVTTNLTAESITLGGMTETNWTGVGSVPLQGYKYVVVTEGTNDVQRGNNLQAAYSTATTLGPTSSNRVAVIVPPGAYNLGSTSLVMNTSYVDFIGLVPSQMTSRQVFTNSAGRISTKTVANVQCHVLIYGSASAGTLVQTLDYIRIESVILTNTGSGVAYSPSVFGTNTALRHVSMSSMGGNAYAGEYIDCVGSDNSFGGNGNDATGTFIDCVGGDYSFAGSGGNASGTFIDCTGGDDTFGSFDYSGNDTGIAGTASGSFKGCTAGDESFGGNAQAIGTFIDCGAGIYSFGGGDPDNEGSPSAAGTFVNCLGGTGSFGGNDGGLSYPGNVLANAAKLQHCQGGNGSFGKYNIASQDFNYNVGGTNTFLMLPQLPTSTNGLASGTVYNSSGTLKIMP